MLVLAQARTAGHQKALKPMAGKLHDIVTNAGEELGALYLHRLALAAAAAAAAAAYYHPLLNRLWWLAHVVAEMSAWIKATLASTVPT